jgi:hypothetical protein
MDPAIALTGPHGPVTLLDLFEGRRQLIAYYFMWQAGQPAEARCEGCAFYTTQVRELSYLHSRNVTYATLCQGPYDESVRPFIDAAASVSPCSAQVKSGRRCCSANRSTMLIASPSSSSPPDRWR